MLRRARIFFGDSSPRHETQSRSDIEINHHLNLLCSPRFSCASLLVDATPGSRPTPRIPPVPSFLFLLFPLFPFSLFYFSPFLFHFSFLSSSPSFPAHARSYSLLTRTPCAPCPRAPRASDARRAARRSAQRRSPLPDPSRRPVPASTRANVQSSTPGIATRPHASPPGRPPPATRHQPPPHAVALNARTVPRPPGWPYRH